MDAGAFNYYAGGACDEITLRDNLAALARYRLRPRVLVDVSRVDTSYLDGGVRRGTDVLVALALGARAVFIGRPYLFALAAGGEAGVARALELLAAELETAMKLLGTTAASAVTRAHVKRIGQAPRVSARS